MIDIVKTKDSVMTEHLCLLQQIKQTGIEIIILYLFEIEIF